MTLSRDTRLARSAASTVDAPLTPEDFFVLTRIEGTPTVAEVVASSGMPRAQAEQILVRLLELGVIRECSSDAVKKAPAPPMPSRPGPLRLRGRADERRRVLLRAELRAGPRASASPSLEPDPETQDDDGADGSEGFVLPMVARDDPRLNVSIGIDLDEQRWLLALADGQDHLSPFEFLGVSPTHDMKLIRRAFHEMSRRLHPDAYYGRDLGPYHGLVTELFRRAKFYFEELRTEDVRKPYVEQAVWARADRELQRRLSEHTAESEALRRDAQAATELARRRQERATHRAERERESVRQRLQEGAQAHIRDAEAALVEGNLARAANAFRLALQIEPENAALRKRWVECRAASQRKRAAEAFAEAQRHLEFGHDREALPLLVEAAEYDPTLEHLVAVTEALLEVEPARARDFAMAAFDALVVSQAKGEERSPAERAAMHVTIGRAFLGVGQKESAKQQVLAARALRPDDPEVRTLLKSLKVK